MSENSLNDAVTMCPGASEVVGAIDQYELKRELGGGGFGCVYLARDTVAGIEVAVKGLPPLVRQNKEELENIRRNFALVSRLHHPNIAAALTLHPVSKAVYNNKSDAEKLRVFEGDTLVVMQYAPGVTLSQWRKQFPDSKVPFGKALEIVRQIASALDYAHQEKILHRDIKPANVMIETAVDGKLTARVLDFGLAAEIRSSMGRVSQQVCDTSGTRPYMAPEQWLGKEQGKETDLYALAVLFYELVTGKVPFASVFDTGDPIVMMNVVGREEPELTSDLPKSICAAILKALAKKREERFDSCVAFVDALAGHGSNAATSGKFFGKIAAIGLLALGLVGGVWYWQDAKAKEEARIVAEQKAEADRKAAEEARRIAAEKAKAELEQKKKEEEVRIAAEKAKLEAEERARKAEEARIAAEKKAEEEKRIREELVRKMEADRKAAEEARLAAEQAKVEAEERARKAKEESHDKVQLWEGGPYWATMNIGADKPEDFGYYFWWGDTVGYKRVNARWVASDGSNSNFSFSDDNTPTYKKSISTLENEGWITSDGVLAPEHDAAHVHWGNGWRMPTKQELDNLVEKCNWTWSTRNGIKGYVVHGKGSYASKSIFLPAAGRGYGTSLSLSVSFGFYCSSVPISDYDNYAWGLDFYSSGHVTGNDDRGYGQSVRPVLGSTK